MAGALKHSPADVVAALLTMLGLVTDPILDPGDVWPVYVDNEPSSPDETVTVYDAEGRKDGRTMVDGEVQEHHGFQVRVRSVDHPTGYAKARAIAVALDQRVYQTIVPLGGSVYSVHEVTRDGDVLVLGKESPTSKRSLFTLNCVTALREVS